MIFLNFCFFFNGFIYFKVFFYYLLKLFIIYYIYFFRLLSYKYYESDYQEYILINKLNEEFNWIRILIFFYNLGIQKNVYFFKLCLCRKDMLLGLIILGVCVNEKFIILEVYCVNFE